MSSKDSALIFKWEVWDFKSELSITSCTFFFVCKIHVTAFLYQKKTVSTAIQNVHTSHVKNYIVLTFLFSI
jgi:hypothetical protein